MVFSKNRKIVIFFLLFYMIVINICNAFANIKPEKLDKFIDLKDTDIYKDADVNIRLAKQIKHDRKRRIELKNSGYSNDEIKRILNEEKGITEGVTVYDKNSALQDELRKKEDEVENVNNDNNKNNVLNDVDSDINDDDEYILIRKKKKNGKTVEKRNKVHLIEDDVGDKYGAINDKQSFVVKKQDKQSNDKIIFMNAGNGVNAEKNGNQNLKKNNEILKHDRQKYLNLIPQIPKLPSEMDKQNQDNYYKNNSSSIFNWNDSGYVRNDKERFAMLTNQLGNLTRSNGDKKETEIIQKMAEKNAFNYSVDGINNFVNEVDLGDKSYGEKKLANKKRQMPFNSGKIVASNNDAFRNVKKPKNTSATSSRFYAYTRPNIKKILDDMNKNGQVVDGAEKKQDIDDIDIEQTYDFFSNSQDANVEIAKSKYTEGQLIAKQIGAPRPVLRAKKSYNTQISPQNISQVKYDKNNQHLEPAMFQSQVINDVFANLGSNNATEIARALINQVGKVDIVDADGNSLLMHSVARKNQSLTSMLLSEGANANLLNKDGFSPLHLASTNGDDTALYYLMMAGGDPNLRDGDGNTSLMYAAMTCNKQTLQMMISMGADLQAVNFANKNKSVLDYAAMNTSHPDVYQFLKDKIYQTKLVMSKDLNSAYN